MVKIKFNEAAHTYTHIDTKEKYISVTTFLAKYKPPFDADKHATRVAKRECVSKELVLETWEEEKNRACDRGTHIHKLLEEYIKAGEVEDTYGWLYKSYDKVVERTIDPFDTVLCENLLYNEDVKIAGTADLIYEHKGNEFTVGDFKTNKRFRFSSQYKERMHEPVTHLDYCEFNMYALQLSFYAWLHEKQTGKRCRKCVVFYLKDDRFIPYHINYLKTDIYKILRESNLGGFQYDV